MGVRHLANLRPRLGSLVSGLPPSYWFLWSGTVVNRLGGFVVPFLTLYLTGERGVSPDQAALVVSLFGAGSFASALVGGELTDRLGRRPVMLMSFFAAPVAMTALGLSSSLPPVMVLTALLGFFTDLYRPAVSASIADLVPPEERPRAFGYLYWAINLGAALAPLIAGLMARHNYFLLFAGDALTTLAFGVIVMLRVPETQPAHAVPAARSPLRRRIENLRKEPILLLFSGLAIVLGSIYAQGIVTLPLEMQLHGLAPSDYGMVAAVNGGLIVLVTLQLSKAAGRWPRFAAMGAAALLLGIGFGLTNWATSVPFFALTVVVWTLGEIVASSVAPTIISDLSPVDLRGLYQGVFGSAWGLSFLVGPLIGGAVFHQLGSGALWLGCLGLGTLLCLLYLVLGAAMKDHVGRTSALGDSASEAAESGEVA